MQKKGKKKNTVIVDRLQLINAGQINYRYQDKVGVEREILFCLFYKTLEMVKESQAG